MENSTVFDIQQIRVRLQPLLGDNGFYPTQLEAKFPRILNEIVVLWGKPELDDYLNSLMVTERTDRVGFPAAVASELLHLSSIHGALPISQGTLATGWGGAT